MVEGFGFRVKGTWGLFQSSSKRSTVSESGFQPKVHGAFSAFEGFDPLMMVLIVLPFSTKPRHTQSANSSDYGPIYYAFSSLERYKFYSKQKACLEFCRKGSSKGPHDYLLN